MPIKMLKSMTGTPYKTPSDLIKEQQTWNFLDAVKDGINKQLLIDLKIYPLAGEPVQDTLHEHENKLIELARSNITQRTWTKTKKDSEMNLIQTHYYFWESGLGHEHFIQVLPEGVKESMVTFGSHIDPLSKPGKVWPKIGESVELTPSFMEHTGFGKSYIKARTFSDTAFEYTMTIGCGMSCGANKCVLRYDPSKKAKEDTTYFKGNNEKNAFLKGTGNSDKKTIFAVTKGWGDKVQVLLYYIFYHVQKQAKRIATMTTCDMVVYSLCLILNIPCIYTGKYDRPVDVDTKVIRGGSGSFYSILEYKPGTPLDTAKQNRLNKIAKMVDENQQTINSMVHLSNHPTTEIMIQGVEHIFTKEFYDGVIADMTQINDELDGLRNRSTNSMSISQLENDMKKLDKNYLIIPIIKKKGKSLTMLMTNCYTLNKNKSKPNLINGAGTFYSIAMAYGVIRLEGGYVGGSRSSSMLPEQLNSFPESDHSPKWFEYTNEYQDHALYTQKDIDQAPVFGVDDTPRKMDLQAIFDQTFTTAFNNVFGNLDDNFYETLYTLYIYEAQYAGTAGVVIKEADIRRLIEVYLNESPRSLSARTLKMIQSMKASTSISQKKRTSSTSSTSSTRNTRNTRSIKHTSIKHSAHHKSPRRKTMKRKRTPSYSSPSYKRRHRISSPLISV